MEAISFSIRVFPRTIASIQRINGITRGSGTVAAPPSVLWCPSVRAARHSHSGSCLPRRPLCRPLVQTRPREALHRGCPVHASRRNVLLHLDEHRTAGNTGIRPCLDRTLGRILSCRGRVAARERNGTPHSVAGGRNCRTRKGRG